MKHVRVKRFLDSEQVRIYEKQMGCDRLEDGLKKSYLYAQVHEKGEYTKYNPFTGQFEKMKEYKEVDKLESMRVSRSRCINKVYDIARSNMWEYFMTFTFNPEKVNSFDYSVTSKKLSQWLNNMRKKCPHMIYVVVPEKHKSGRWHFHGLFSDVDELELVSSGKFTDKGQEIFNVGNYKLGFSTAIMCDGSPKVVTYLCKYLTKEVCEVTQGKKRYWVSRNVKLPEIIDFDVDMDIDDILGCCDLENSHIKSVEGYINVSYIDAPIYSTNTCFSNR